MTKENIPATHPVTKGRKNSNFQLITVATHDIAESLAHLIDGYQIMYNQGSSVFKMKGLFVHHH